MASTNISEQLIETLASYSSDAPLLSLYLPTALEVDERHQNEIRIKNLLKEGQARLEALGMSVTDARALSGKVQDASFDRTIWEEHGRGFAIFAGQDFMSHVSLPYPVRDLVVAASRFHLKPLFDALGRTRHFYVLALSQNDISLYSGDGTALSKVDLGPEVPTKLTEVTGRQPAGKQLHYHSADRGGDVAIFHGLGAGKDDTDAEVERFIRSVSEALGPYLKEEDAPLIVAGVESLLTVYRQVSDSAERIRGEISGNVEHWSESELHEKAWPFVSERLDERRAAALERLDHSDAAVPVSRELDDVVRAAADGRVDTLFIAADAECWGRYDDSERSIARHDEPLPGDTDLLDRAAVESYLRGGEVYAIPASEIPGNSVAIAGLRY